MKFQKYKNILKQPKKEMKLCDYHRKYHGYQKHFPIEELDKEDGKYICSECEYMKNMGGED